MARGRERHGPWQEQTVLEEVWAGVEEARTSRMVSKWQKGAQTRKERRLTCNVIWQAEPQHMKLMLQVVYNQLPSPADMHFWSKSDSSTCCLRSGKATLEQILNNSAAQGEGRDWWRDDQGLKSVTEVILGELDDNKPETSRSSHFVKGGEKGADGISHLALTSIRLGTAG